VLIRKILRRKKLRFQLRDLLLSTSATALRQQPDWLAGYQSSIFFMSTIRITVITYSTVNADT